MKKVFKKTPKLDPSMVLTPLQVGESDALFDLILVDETHLGPYRARHPRVWKADVSVDDRVVRH
ncbi:hypothetical protein [Microbacterium sp. KRD172]|uniref:hypothetical protein n=1 Tax=Microbacterium sp. KRD172 TaxID=2729727 RepID=UPI001F49DE3D|nr:hypothetical protein [Microbacterium sp. KRD172]